jgi:hypothetical protein
MAPPWIAIIDAALGLANIALTRRGREQTADEEPLRDLGEARKGPRTLETQLAGVVVAALKEVFERDTRRLDLERELAEAERQRAERALRLELLRQAGDREIGYLRLMAGIVVVSWLATLFLLPRVIAGGTVPRLLVGIGWTFLLSALACAFTALSGVARAIQRADETRASSLPPRLPGAFAAWLTVIGLALVGLAALLG